jgi:PAS domain S-box-containing protein
VGLDRRYVVSRGSRLHVAALTGPLELKRTSVDKTGIDERVLESGRVRVVDSTPPVFQGAASGFSIPLVAGGEIYGSLDVGYDQDASSCPTAEDEPTLIPIANHLSVALRNVRLHAETALLKDYLSKLIDNADALILGIDRNWRVTFVNQAMVRLGGYPPAEVIGTDVRQWVPAPAQTRIVTAIAHALAGHATPSIDVDLMTKSGDTVRTIWNVAAIGAGRAVEAVVAVGQDVTRLKSLERQVIQAEKLATLGQLAAGVVHELNNPLTSIIVYADFLLKKLDRGDPGDVEKLRRILEGAQRILNFSRNLVQYAKPSSEQLDVVSLNDIVRQSLSFCEHILKNAQVDLSLSLEAELPPLYAVRGQLQQVVINLVTNAVQAIRAAGGRVTVATARRGDRHVAISVADDGAGIRPEDRAKIFEPFFTTKTDGRGTGLGLSIVRNIVEDHHGSIEVDSVPGRGARFTIVLPTGRQG